MIFTPSKPIRKIRHKTHQNTHYDILMYIVHLS
ncbi:hypothetical protein GGR08_001222 [Bartonella fuyuanensis]|uniref:Uncharacterized protein n=1 Tax=Bartonella fuyuanensis TaxID=1460968 RepID=A0A840DV60_9HYPH|nr:hypothetical protein [Bartonella fuyuanensis]